MMTLMPHLRAAELTGHHNISGIINMATNTRKTSSTCGLALVTVNVAGFREMLLTMLGASSVSALRFVIRLRLTEAERIHYLNPIRDIFGDTDWIDNEIGNGARVAMVGFDVKAIMDRIGDPTMCWTGRRLNIWLIIMKRHVYDDRDSDGFEFDRRTGIHMSDRNSIRKTLEMPLGLAPCREQGVSDLINGFYIWCPYMAAGVGRLTVWHYSDHVGRYENWFESSADDPPTSLEEGIVQLEGKVLKEGLLGVVRRKHPHVVAPTISFADLTRSVVVHRRIRPRLMDTEPQMVGDNEVVLRMERVIGDLVTYSVVFDDQDDADVPPQVRSEDGAGS